MATPSSSYTRVFAAPSLLLALLVLTPSCEAVEVPSGVDVAAAGQLALPIGATGESGVSYRLRDAVFVISGPTSTTIESEDHLLESSVRLTLPLGSYTVELMPGWTLEMWDGSTGIPLMATLHSENPRNATVASGILTRVTFEFEVGDNNFVVMAPGMLEIGIAIDDLADEDDGGGCSDGIDNDANGAVDCRDAACLLAGDPACEAAAGAADLAIVRGDPGPHFSQLLLEVARGNGKGGFAAPEPAQPIEIMPNSGELVFPRLADVDGDGDDDLVNINTALVDDAFSWLIVDTASNDGSGSFSTLALVVDVIGFYQMPREGLGAAAGDVTGDGLADVMSLHLGSFADGDFAYVQAAAGNGDGTFDERGYGMRGHYLSDDVANLRVGMGDFDGNGYADLAIAHLVEAGGLLSAVVLEVAPGDGAGDFLPPPKSDLFAMLDPVPVTDLRLQYGDVNGDGWADVVVIRMFKSGGLLRLELQTAFGNGDFTFTDVQLSSVLEVANDEARDVFPLLGQLD